MRDHLLYYLLPFYAKDDAAGSGSDDDAAGGKDADDGAEDNQEASGEAGEGAEGEGEEQQAKPDKADWRDRQLAKRNRQLAEERGKTAKLQEIEAENARLKALLEAAKPGGGGGGGAAAAGSEASEGARAVAPAAKGLTEAEVEARAEQKAAQKQFDRDVAAALAKGANTYKDWEQSIANIKAADGFDPEVLAQILGTDDPAKIIYELGKDPEKFEAFNAMPSNKRMAEFVKMTLEKPAKKAISNAAEPVNPVGGRGVQSAKVNVYDPNISDEDYYAARQAQAAGDKRARARYARGLSGD